MIEWALKKDTGVGVVQSITIPEARYDVYVQSEDFIRKWVRPLIDRLQVEVLTTPPRRVSVVSTDSCAYTHLMCSIPGRDPSHHHPAHQCSLLWLLATPDCRLRVEHWSALRADPARVAPAVRAQLW